MGRRPKIRPEDVDWSRVRKLARQTFTGHGQSDDDMSYMAACFKADPERYTKETGEVREAERDFIRNGFRSIEGAYKGDSEADADS